ncbi:MAG: hypothetical protein AB7E81_16520 [Hyphomicrobiaceae bacterium]
MTLTLARLGAWGAVASTLVCNGLYGWSQGAELPQKLGMLAIAATIDLCKCGFLPAAANQWTQGFRLRALLIAALLWPLALAYSTFCGYSTITTTRTTASSGIAAEEQERARAQRHYDDATAALASAERNPLWAASSACQAIKSRHRSFCANVARTRTERASAETILARTRLVTANPEARGIASFTGIDFSSVVFWIAFWPALLIELIASIAFYATGKPAAPAAQNAPVKAHARSVDLRVAEPTKTQPQAALAPPASTASPAPPSPPRYKWS